MWYVLQQLILHFISNEIVKELLKSVHICRSYCKQEERSVERGFCLIAELHLLRLTLVS